jgi:site-specific DNA recombinase
MTVNAQPISRPTIAIGYARVSTKGQETDGDGLSSQEACIRDYARQKGYEIEKVFRETVTGKARNRPVMSELIRHLRKHKREGRIVIIDDISRFARGHRAHWPLRDELEGAGGILESPRLQFGDDPASVLLEGVMVTVAQHQREHNAQQTKSRMRGRLLNGYWPFAALIGYRYQKKRGESNLLVRDEPAASIITEGLEGFASGRFQTQTELKRFLESQPGFPKSIRGTVKYEVVLDLLTRPLYAGYIEMPAWDVSLRKAKHEGLISFETFDRNQRRLKGEAKAPARADINQEFPLRGMLACVECGKPMTSCWSTSKTGVKHPYYMCFAKGCTRYRKSIRREQVETAFAGLLERLTPTQKLAELALAMFKDAWNQRSAQAAVLARSAERELAKVEKQIVGLLDRVVEATSPTIIKRYEQHIMTLERSKALLEEQAGKKVQRGSFEELFELALRFLSRPVLLWNSKKFAHKRLVVQLAFAERLAFCPNAGFRTPKTSLPFKLLEGLRRATAVMAEREGFEPPIGLHLCRISSAVRSTTLPPLRAP